VVNGRLAVAVHEDEEVDVASFGVPVTATIASPLSPTDYTIAIVDTHITLGGLTAGVYELYVQFLDGAVLPVDLTVLPDTR